ncbi:MAG: T9SS type A sorting domain-containing protein [Ignavibacteriaceae bacterium]|nr:T9SS type A sorting domain-containing protein [Ignavibacteriaceae bacterium]
MKKVLLSLSLIFVFSVLSIAQVTVFSDNFDSYLAGEQLACQNPTDWTTWSSLPCDPVEDGYVSSNYAHSGSNSFVIVQNNDQVHEIGPYTSGKWEVNWQMYIPTGASGYFNTLSIFAGAASEWGMQAYLNVGGAGTLDAGGVTAATFTYPNDTWIFVQVIVDLDIDQAQFWMDGTMIYQWQWTLGALGGGGSLQLNANDFFGAVATDETYYDDYQVLDLIIPVELTSFTASVNEGNVVLNWSTATETNNHLFEIERKAVTSEYITIGYVEGAGTTTEPQNYSYADNEVETGTYTYRLKQVDFDGTFTYSNEVEVDVTAPLSFNLDQNYPNPFNPTTNINYSIQEAGNIILAVYNTVGEKVAVLVNGYSEAGHFEVSFDASNLPSGVYLYKLQSANSVQTKKMMLLK